MKTESVSKIKYLKLWDILRQETDEQHPMSTTDIIARLAALGISCDRRTLYRNIDELNEYGFEILKRKGNYGREAHYWRCIFFKKGQEERVSSCC